MYRIVFLIGVATVFTVSVFGQGYHFPLNRDLLARIGPLLAEDTSGFHTSFLPYANPELNRLFDTEKSVAVDGCRSKFYSTWVGRKLRLEHLLEVDKDDIRLSVDPLFNFQLGKDRNSGRKTFVNTRGVQVQGNYHNDFYFYTAFHENQARYLSYVDSTIRQYEVVPGQGRVKFLENEVVDFSNSTGGIAYVLNRHFDFLLAQDRLFIGDGYRSMLLSDNSHPFPFLRANMTFWKFRYSAVYAVMQDLQTPALQNAGYPKKYSTFHYLDLNIGRRNRLTVGLFEAVIWQPAASRGYELHYLNPMLFLRPVENSLGSPDNALLGLNVRWKASNSLSLYGQLLLDEFLLDEVRSGRGWWGNKQALQFGIKTFDVAGISGLHFQSEFNLARPFTYQHRTNAQSYTHYNQALAHPLGAGFYESVSMVNYRYRNLLAEVKFQYAVCGRDTGGVNLGNDIFQSYDTRPSEYGYYLPTGDAGILKSIAARVNYLVNAKTNFRVEVGIEHRNFSNDDGGQRSRLIYIGFRTALQNYYFDF
jgi:hypothetical protein